MVSASILIIEDEPKIAAVLADYLKAHGHECNTISRGDEALAFFRESTPDLVLLDLMLPGLDGIEVCKQIRRESEVPIIMITARVEEIDRLLGLELGADDYICKPFSPREVVARVKAVLRRSARSGLPPRDGLVLDSNAHAATLDGIALDLTPVEFSLLNALRIKSGRVLSREQLMNEMYDDYRVVSDRAVDSHIKNLRRKLESAVPGADLVEAVYGVGYRFKPERGAF
jgi:two-component system response regulator BaeR